MPNVMRRIVTPVLAAVATISAALGVVYLVVACESLPSFLGAVPGDAHPRTRLGAALLIFALFLAAIALIARRRQAD